MGKIIFVDLSTREINSSFFCNEDFNNSGRGLATKYIIKHVEKDKSYYSENNCIVLTPGLLTGTQAPCSGRLTIAAKGENSGIKTMNIAGPIAQKIASLGIAAIVVTGRKQALETFVLHIGDDSIAIHDMQVLKHKAVEETIDYLQDLWGENTSILGIGPAGEHVLPMASVFSTYAKGFPKYYCSRGKMGDLFGFKGLKAIAVTTKKHFDAPIHAAEDFRLLSKKLSKIIMEHPVCGGALPAYGSITLIEMMKDKNNFLQQLQEKSKLEDKKKIHSPKPSNIKINNNCAPNCVIGCLNRHSSNKGFTYNSPAESEAVAACKNLFKIEDHAFVSSLNKSCFEMGIDTIEFLFSANMLLKALEEKATKEKLHQLLQEIKDLTPMGRILASTTKGIYSLFTEKRELEALITLPALLEEAKFIVNIPSKMQDMEELSDLAYLYGFMTIMGNLGICLFTAFAILDAEDGLDIMADLVGAKIGKEIKASQLMEGALIDLKMEREYTEKIKKENLSDAIPEFVKVLYRYFGEEKENVLAL